MMQSFIFALLALLFVFLLVSLLLHESIYFSIACADACLKLLGNTFVRF
jgi:hypothetical protein